jgi:hypothetical protein
MLKEDFIGQLEHGMAMTRTLAHVSTILALTVDQLKKGEPAWWRELAVNWEMRRFAGKNEAYTLYLTALHYEALGDPLSPLAACFPTRGAIPGAGLAPALAQFLAAPPPSFFANLRSRTWSPYRSTFSALWIGPALLYFERDRALPFYLIDAEAGAGLNLVADFSVNQQQFNSELVTARIGIDLHPLDLKRTEDRRWLTAAIWSGAPDGIANLDRAAAALQELLSEQDDFVQLVASPPDKVAQFVAKNIPSDDRGVGILIFNIFMTSRMNDADYAAYRAGMSKTLEDWGDRGLWVEVENVRAAAPSSAVELRVHRFNAGQLQTFVMARLEAGAAPAYGKAVEAFLSVA